MSMASLLANYLGNSQTLSVLVEDIDTTWKPAHSYGADSLVAVELRFWFSNEVKVNMFVFNILANDSIAELG
ncbi:uncharacterized protein F4807DRAFT_375528 [Annulohypoxylon truncatum]|uniref:uncharacterized protein n=1 Tax=Annulohypoxylon truncatum TaxID=327061 RepID=UPI002008753B|nr:uncharacterized protein F4807DRAFT_375528 [Annulohypoxylon truncatum]KAI1204107.1 hypothetical protein F4807DRAFT_375528 [Annulohypoxylon truncatum]